MGNRTTPAGQCFLLQISPGYSQVKVLVNIPETAVGHDARVISSRLGITPQGNWTGAWTSACTSASASAPKCMSTSTMSVDRHLVALNSHHSFKHSVSLAQYSLINTNQASSVVTTLPDTTMVTIVRVQYQAHTHSQVQIPMTLSHTSCPFSKSPCTKPSPVIQPSPSVCSLRQPPHQPNCTASQ